MRNVYYCQCQGLIVVAVKNQKEAAGGGQRSRAKAGKH